MTMSQFFGLSLLPSRTPSLFGYAPSLSGTGLLSPASSLAWRLVRSHMLVSPHCRAGLLKGSGTAATSCRSGLRMPTSHASTALTSTPPHMSGYATSLIGFLWARIHALLHYRLY